MAVLLETSLGNIVVDLFTEECPITTKNFLKLCKSKYYNNVLFFNVQENFMIQTGDPTGTGSGGCSIYGALYGDQAKYFEDEIRPELRHNKKGLVCMANSGKNTNTSQFFITCRDSELEPLDDKHTIFGVVNDGIEVVDEINQLYCDSNGRPYQDVRIKHTHIFEDPFPNPDLLKIPPSPDGDRPTVETVQPRISVEEGLDENSGRTEAEIERSLREKEAKSRAVVLEMIGDLPDADVKPPEEVLFVCKLNAVTTDEDLEVIFSRFGPCNCEIIRDFKTNDSLCYGFVEFQKKSHCEEAYFKMNNVLIDDRRIKVDFSQSVSKLWNKFKRRPWERHGKDDADPYKMEAGIGSDGKCHKKRAAKRCNYEMEFDDDYGSALRRRNGHGKRERVVDSSHHRKRTRESDRYRGVRSEGRDHRDRSHVRDRDRDYDRHNRRRDRDDYQDRRKRSRSRSQESRRRR